MLQSSLFIYIYLTQFMFLSMMYILNENEVETFLIFVKIVPEMVSHAAFWSVMHYRSLTFIQALTFLTDLYTLPHLYFHIIALGMN